MNVSEVMPNGNVRIIVPINFKKTRTGSVITKAESMKALQNQIPLIAAIADGIQWQQWIDDGLFKNVTELAAHLGRDRARVSHTLQLALLSPEIIHLIIIGALPNHITLRIVNRSFPADWEEQKKFFGIK